MELQMSGRTIAIGYSSAVVVAVLAVCWWNFLGTRTCELAASLGGEPAGNAECVEFWLNRYQTLLAGIFTLFAAGVAWFAVKRQMRHTETLATRDGRKSAEALAVAFNKYADELEDTPGDPLIDASYTAKHVQINIEMIRDRLFSDDLVDVVWVYNQAQTISKFIEVVGNNKHPREVQRDAKIAQENLIGYLRTAADRIRSRNAERRSQL